MRSLIILEVEHGEDTDKLQSIIDHTVESNEFVRAYYKDWPKITNYTVRVDLPECFRLDS